MPVMSGYYLAPLGLSVPIMLEEYCLISLSMLTCGRWRFTDEPSKEAIDAAKEVENRAY